MVFIFTYDIAGTMNIMAWMSEAPQEKQIEIQQKVNYVLTFFEELGVPKQEIVSEMQNIYVDTRTEEVKVVLHSAEIRVRWIWRRSRRI